MESLNRQDRYDVMRIIIKTASPEVIASLIKDFGYNLESKEDVEVRRKELLRYLDEMYTCWNNQYIDGIDEQSVLFGVDRYRR